MYIYRLALLPVFILAVFCLSAAPSQSQSDLQDYKLPPYVRLVETPSDLDRTTMPDSVYYRDAGRVIFKVNRTEMRDNDPLLIQLADSVLPYANRMGWMLVGIDLRGAASPEGPYYNNVRLSVGRAGVLADFLRARLDSVQIEELYTRTIAEDYAYLLWQLERAGDSAAPLLRRIIDARGLDNPAAIKADLQALYDGRYWQRLLRDYFPHIRAARVVLYFRPMMKPADAGTPQMAVTDPVEPRDLVPVEPFWTPAPLWFERPHLLSLSSNLLYDAFYMPQFGWAPMLNIAAEWYPRSGPWTLRAQFTSPYYHRWNRNKFFQIRDYHLELRRYLSPGQYHTGWYGAAYVNAAKYGVGLGPDKGWQGEGLGGALKIGYVLPLGGRRWRLDMHVAAGAFITKYDPYVYGNPITGEITGNNSDDYYYDWTGPASAFQRRNHRFSWFGPTEIGLTLTYDLLYYRLHRPGASFLSRELLRY